MCIKTLSDDLSESVLLSLESTTQNFSSLWELLFIAHAVISLFQYACIRKKDKNSSTEK